MIWLLIVIVVGVLSVWVFDKRYKGPEASSSVPPPGFSRTDEVMTDPTTGRRQRVYYNEETGERLYLNE